MGAAETLEGTKRAVRARELANWICEVLRANGFEALLVGGCVRDMLLGRTPLDFDVTTDATPEQVRELFPEALDVGAQFGVMLILREGIKVEVATFRTDVAYSDGRHPDKVVFSKTAQEDVQRRDFTINGLLMRADSNEVLDFVGGQADLKARIVRTIGKPLERFTEDKLRMLRAVRFAARFDFQIEAETFAAMRSLAGQIQQVSAERVRDELTKILTEGAARRGFELLEESGLLREVLPEVAATRGVQQPPQFHPEGDVWIHMRMMLEGLAAGGAATLAWGVLLHDIGKPPTYRSPEQTGDRIRFDGHAEIGAKMAEAICRRLRFSTEETEQIVALVANHMKFKDVTQMRTATLKRFVRMPDFEQHLRLHELDCGSSNQRFEAFRFVKTFLEETPPEQVRPERLVTGNDLKAMGYVPGPAFSRILAEVEDAQLEDRVATKEQAMELIQREFPLGV